MRCLIFLKLFVNLRNAAESFGTESKQYQGVHDTVYGHLRQMQASGQKTDLTGTKTIQKDTSGLADAFEKLDLELKGKSGESGEAMEQ